MLSPVFVTAVLLYSAASPLASIACSPSALLEIVSVVARESFVGTELSVLSTAATPDALALAAAELDAELELAPDDPHPTSSTTSATPSNAVAMPASLVLIRIAPIFYSLLRNYAPTLLRKP